MRKKETWIEVVKKLLEEHGHGRVLEMTGAKRVMAEILAKQVASKVGVDDVIVVTPRGFASTFKAVSAPRSLDGKWTVIIDESHHLPAGGGK